MLSRFSSLKSLNHLPVSLSLSTMSSLTAARNPRTHLRSNFEVLNPQRLPLFNQQKNKALLGAQFFKKNQEKAKELLHEFVHMIVHGSKSAYRDAKSLYSIISSKPKSDRTVEEIREVKRITVDLIKFVPFYASIIIPAGELALIPYLFLFPRAVPSYFIAEKARKENKDKLMENQFQAHQHLKQYLLDVMSQAGYNQSVRDLESLRKFFVENKEQIMPLLASNKMDSKTLRSASDFLMFEYLEGTYIMNLLYKTTVNLPRHCVNLAMWISRNSYRAEWSHPVLDYSFQMNSFPLEGIKRRLLRYQFEKQVKTLEAQNQAIMGDLYGNLGDETVLDLAKERGFYSNDGEQARNWLSKEWKQVAETHKGDNGMSLFWQSVIQYESL